MVDIFFFVFMSHNHIGFFLLFAILDFGCWSLDRKSKNGFDFFSEFAHRCVFLFSVETETFSVPIKLKRNVNFFRNAQNLNGKFLR